MSEKKWDSESILEIAVDALHEQETAEGEVFVSMPAKEFYLLGCAMRDLEEMIDDGMIIDLSGSSALN